MAVKVTYRELQRLSTKELLGKLGGDMAYVFSNGEVILKIRACDRIDSPSDCQPTVKVKSTKQELQDMIHKIENKVPEPSIIPAVPWYDTEKHTSGDTVRMRDPKTKEVKVVTL